MPAGSTHTHTTKNPDYYCNPGASDFLSKNSAHMCNGLWYSLPKVTSQKRKKYYLIPKVNILISNKPFLFNIKYVFNVLIFLSGENDFYDYLLIFLQHSNYMSAFTTNI